MSDERLDEVRIVPLESGFIVTRAFRDEYDERDEHRTAEPTLYGALTLAARALGYRGTIEFGSRTVEVPVVGMVPPNLGIASLRESERLALAERAFDDEEPSLRAFSSGDRL